MEVNKKIQAADDGLQLPEAVIQLIQSYLSGKEAASTAVLSKSWYNSWLTRPSLHFDEGDFRSGDSDPQDDGKFVNFVKRSVGRYDELNLNIDTFTLCMNVRGADSSSFAAELTANAVKMGASGINIEYHPPLAEFPLPKELFESKHVVGLSLFGCKILMGEVMCLRLKSLSLSKVRVEEVMLGSILKGCPLLEVLFLSNCEGFKKLHVNKMAELKRFIVVRRGARPLISSIPLIELGDRNVGSVVHGRVNVREFWRLSYLLLERVKISMMLFCNFSNKFPCLEELTVLYCEGCVRYNISSQSLKYMTLAQAEKLQVQLDVPNLVKFKFSGSIIPCLSLSTCTRELESEIAFTCWNTPCFSWFCELKNFLTKLTPFKTSLSIDLLSNHIYFTPHFQGFPKPVVENLVLTVHSSISACSSLLDCIIWSFQPKVVTLHLFPIPEKCDDRRCNLLHPEFRNASNKLLQVLRKKLTDLENCDRCYTTDKMIGWHELEEANAEYFEDTLMEWRPLPTKTLFPEKKEVQIRFRLRWGQSYQSEPNHGQAA